MTEGTKVITLKPWVFWTLKGIIATLFIIVAVGGAYFYGEYIENKAYLTNRQDFISRYVSVQYEHAGEAFCYEPRGKLTRKATYKGHGMYKVEDR